jgi:hypothetical protein
MSVPLMISQVYASKWKCAHWSDGKCVGDVQNPAPEHCVSPLYCKVVAYYNTGGILDTQRTK